VEKRFEYLAQLAAVFIMVAGCFLVLRPFLAAILLALVVCVSTWPLYLGLLRSMKGRQNIAALTMTLSLALAVILPLALVAYNLADNVTAFYNMIRQAIEAGPPDPPTWLKDLPIVGNSADAYWHLSPPTARNCSHWSIACWNPPRVFCLPVESCLDGVSW
jgi:predicted PurR-regulated permease PerM